MGVLSRSERRRKAFFSLKTSDVFGDFGNFCRASTNASRLLQYPPQILTQISPPHQLEPRPGNPPAFLRPAQVIDAALHQIAMVGKDDSREWARKE
jgi:hypothetical protein